MTIDIRIISIGALSANPLWGERKPIRTGHATTTLIRDKDMNLLVDPGLPAPAVEARLGERAGIRASDITHVFLTSFHPEMRRGLEAFEHATWWISTPEREGVGIPLIARLHEAAEEGDDDLREALERDVALLRRFQGAPDSLAPRIDLFPLHGVTPGLSGLIVSDATRTTVIAGDAAPTGEHLQRAMILPGAADVEKARESLADILETADVVIPGRDNVVLSVPLPRPQDSSAGDESDEDTD